MANTREEMRGAGRGDSGRRLARGVAIVVGLSILAVLLEAVLLYSTVPTLTCEREAREVLEEASQPYGAEPVQVPLTWPLGTSIHGVTKHGVRKGPAIFSELLVVASEPYESKLKRPLLVMREKSHPLAGNGTLGCQRAYGMQGSEEQIYEYYQEQLAAHGWTLVETRPPEASSEARLPRTRILARRDNSSYEVMAVDQQKFETYILDEPYVTVTETVWEPS